MKKKYYAVKAGRKIGIYATWDECKEQVTGFKGAEFKGFETLEEAEGYMNGGDTLSFAANDDTEAVAYVDGSFDITTGRYSYGCVVFHGGEEKAFAEAFDDSERATMRNVAGEIEGSMAAMRYCLEHGIRSVTIFHDYEGIAKWCTGEWKTTKRWTAEYVEFYNNALKKLNIVFKKVKGHSGDKYNDMVDRLAKDALGI